MFEYQFYPTPSHIAELLLSDIPREANIRSVIDVSAGKCDLLKAAYQECKYRLYSKPSCFYAIEIDENLRKIIKGTSIGERGKEKPVMLIGSDFMRFETLQRFDLIVMNPPFAHGAQHLLKAIRMQSNGGYIRCILNAETIRNPYTNERKELVRLLEELNANIRYKEKAFHNAEIKADVDIAMISIDVPKKQDSVIIEHMKKAKLRGDKNEVGTAETHLDSRNYFQIIEARYNRECALSAKLLDEISLVTSEVLREFEPDGRKVNKVFDVYVNSDKDLEGLSEYDKVMCTIRKKYWNTLFQSDEFSKKMTYSLRRQFVAKLDELRFYDFNLENIEMLYAEMTRTLSGALDDEILKLFDDMSYKGYYDEYSKNIHYYNGWRTNKAYIVNKRVIMRIPARWWSGGRISFSYDSSEKLRDIERVFEYLNPDKEEYEDVEKIIRKCEKDGDPGQNKIDFHYFSCIFYQKGTCHITFKDEKLLKKFNLFGSQKKGWLPGTYGKKKYKDMSAEEKQVVDAFEGEKSYNETVRNAAYYLDGSTSIMPKLALKGE